MIKALGVASLLTLGLLVGCSRSAPTPSTPSGKQTQTGGTPESQRDALVADFVVSLTEQQVAAANGDQGLAWGQLTAQQQQTLGRVWDLTADILRSKAKSPEKAAALPEAGPVEYVTVTKVGYSFTDDSTIYAFESQRPPIVTQFEGTVAKPRSLTPALEAHGINLSQAG
jgi:hypothetical protein